MKASGSTSEKPRIVAGLASGKRTLTEVMDHAVAAKRKKREEDSERPVTPARHTPTNTSSKFFGVASTSKMKRPEVGINCELTAGPSRPRLSDANKENIAAVDGDEIDDFFCKRDLDPVIQEDGYVSPSPSLTRLDTPDLSSPLRPGTTSSKRSTDYMDDDGDDFGADVLSSPPTIRSKRSSRSTRANVAAVFHVEEEPAGRVLVCSTPTKPERQKTDIVPGPDLQDIFGDWNDVGDHCDDSADTSMASAMSSCGSNTPQDARVLRETQVGQGHDEILSDIDEDEESRFRQQKIADGWRKQYASTIQPRVKPFTVRCLIRYVLIMTNMNHIEAVRCTSKT